jgi:predicted PolB exonuclease-like 3'-5' exonuclease
MSAVPRLVFDLETIPDLSSLRLIEHRYAHLDDQTLYQTYTEERGQEFFPLHLQKIVAIACVLRWGNDRIHVKSVGDASYSESELLQAFFALIDKYKPQLISWNGHGFDQPVLHYRSMIHSIPCPNYWDTHSDKWNHYLGRYHQRHMDIMDVLSLYQARAFAPLDHLAKLCGGAGKLGSDGGKVFDWYRHGRLEDIRHYCETDVLNTWLVYLRFEYIRGLLNEAQYEQERVWVNQWLESKKDSYWLEFLHAMNKTAFNSNPT